MNIKENLRKLFTEHAVYTKFFIESTLQNSPDISVITNRLLQNQIDIGNYLKYYVGSLNGDKLSDLLKSHILAAASAVNAIKQQNESSIKESITNIFKNSYQVSLFLHSLNPSKIPLDFIHKMFDKHNQYVIDMTILHFQSKFDEEIKKYDDYYTHMLMFSDTISDAISPNYLSIFVFVILFFSLIYYTHTIRINF